MPDYVQRRHGRYWVENPAHPAENFTDKWNEYPDRRRAFVDWHKSITTTLESLAGSHGLGLHKIVATLEKGFPGSDAVRASADRYGDQIRQVREDARLHVARSGSLTTSATAANLIRRHQFYGAATPASD